MTTLEPDRPQPDPDGHTRQHHPLCDDNGWDHLGPCFIETELPPPDPADRLVAPSLTDLARDEWRRRSGRVVVGRADPRCPYTTADGDRCVLALGPDHVADAIYHEFRTTP